MAPALLFSVCSSQPYAFQQVEQEQGDECKQGDEQEGANIPQVRDNHITQVGDSRNDRKDQLVSETENNRACKKA